MNVSTGDTEFPGGQGKRERGKNLTIPDLEKGRKFSMTLTRSTASQPSSPPTSLMVRENIVDHDILVFPSNYFLLYSHHESFQKERSERIKFGCVNCPIVAICGGKSYRPRKIYVSQQSDTFQSFQSSEHLCIATVTKLILMAQSQSSSFAVLSDVHTL